MHRAPAALGIRRGLFRARCSVLRPPSGDPPPSGRVLRSRQCGRGALRAELLSSRPPTCSGPTTARPAPYAGCKPRQGMAPGRAPPGLSESAACCGPNPSGAPGRAPAPPSLLCRGGWARAPGLLVSLRSVLFVGSPLVAPQPLRFRRGGGGTVYRRFRPVRKTPRMLSPAAPAQASPRGALPCPSPSHGAFRLPRCGSRRLGEGRGAHAAFGAKAPAAMPARSRAAVGAPTRDACLRPCGGIVARASRRRSHAAGSRGRGPTRQKRIIFCRLSRSGPGPLGRALRVCALRACPQGPSSRCSSLSRPCSGRRFRRPLFLALRLRTALIVRRFAPAGAWAKDAGPMRRLNRQPGP